MKARAPKEGKKTAAISPYDRNVPEARVIDDLGDESQGRDPPCIGDLLQHTCKGRFFINNDLNWNQTYQSLDFMSKQSAINSRCLSVEACVNLHQ